MSEKRKLKFNLLQQDVYVRECVPVYEDKKDYLINSYISQTRVVENNCVRDKITIEEYPITPESVNSYADGTNYKLDVNAAVSSSPRGKNLGDVAAIKDLFEMSPQDLKDYFANIEAKINSYRSASNVEGEVNNNE